MSKPTKKKQLPTLKTTQIDESSLFAHVSKIIEKRKNHAVMYANREVTLMYWEIGRYIGSVLLGGEQDRNHGGLTLMNLEGSYYHASN